MTSLAGNKKSSSFFFYCFIKKAMFTFCALGAAFSTLLSAFLNFHAAARRMSHNYEHAARVWGSWLYYLSPYA